MKVKVISKRRRSLVRIFASCIPNFVWNYLFPVPPRMRITENIMQNLASLRENMDDDSFCSFKSHFCNTKESQVLYSTPKVIGKQNCKITDLQRELEEIKKQVALLMEHQCEQNQCSGYGTLSNPSEHLVKSLPLSPPLATVPPPPPPPLPNFDPTVVATPLKIQRKNKNSLLVPNKDSYPACLPTGMELLKDLKKVKLRKVEKSPGGGPLKKSKKVDNPADILEAVLRKRFGMVQHSPESSVESVTSETNNSFKSGTCSNSNTSYQVERILKNTIM